MLGRMGKVTISFEMTLDGAFDQKLADHLRARRAAGLARGSDAMAAPFQPALEPRDLGRLARSFAAFESDETPGGALRHESQPNR